MRIQEDENLLPEMMYPSFLTAFSLPLSPTKGGIKKLSVAKALTSRLVRKEEGSSVIPQSLPLHTRIFLLGQNSADLLEGGKGDNKKQNNSCFTCVCLPALQQVGMGHWVQREMKMW